MPVFQVEMCWRCSTCREENLGRHKQCQNCGKPLEGEPFYDAPGTEAPTPEDAVTDAKLIKQATAGSDWECAYCKSHQRRDSGECAQCGAKQGYSKDHETKWDDGTTGPAGKGLSEREEVAQELAKVNRELADVAREIAGDLTLTDTEPSVYPKILDHEVEKRRRRKKPANYRQHTSPTAPTTADIPEDEEPPRQPFWTHRKKVGGAAAVGLAVLSLLCFFLFRTRIVDATVVDHSWEHKIIVERHQITRGEGFSEDEPGDAFDVETAGQHHHHDRKVSDGFHDEPYEDRYQCGQNCRTTPVSCTSNRNGFKTCSGGDRECSPKYCTRTRYKKVESFHSEPVYETWYRWKVWRWIHNRDVTWSGGDTEPQWPDERAVALNVGCSGGEKERATREATYLVTFVDVDHNQHSYTPKGLDEFLRLPKGAKRKLKVRIIGSNEILPEGS